MSVSREDGQRIIELLGLEPIPVEGGLFHQTWRLEAAETIPAGTMLGTAIYAALTDDDDSFSAMHRLTEVEIWHFYAGDPVELLLLHPDGTVDEPVLGPDILGGQHPQVIVPIGTWMGGALAAGGTFALFGTTMTPGFTSGSFETGVREELSAGWPEAAARIERLTRPGAPLHMPDA
ncbi:MAG: cupin domain-containing protein [Ilumatobacteraceae bacterium]